MAEKKDFLSELAQQVADSKSGKRTVDSIDDFTPSKKVVETEYDKENEIHIKQPSNKPEASFSQPKSQNEKPAPQPTPVKQVKPAPQPVEEDVDLDEGYSDDNGPRSFDEEQLVKVDKPKKHISKVAIIIAAVALVVVGIGSYFLFFAPKITMPDFVGKTQDEVGTWAKQNKMDSTAIAVTEVYNFDNASGVVIEQSVPAGTKIKPTTLITLTVSKGADPDEAISFPDIKSMTKDEIDTWVSENKLQKVKITTEYSTTVPDGEVIKYDLKSVDENNFTRGTNLTIVCSKGAAPAGQVTVEDFTGKTYAEMESWATTKKVTLNKSETYSETIEAGRVISQSPKSGEALNQGDAMTVVVSKGKGVTIPNLVGFNKEQLAAWQASPNNTVTVVTKGVYSMSLEGTVVAQDIKPNTVVDTGTVLMLQTSLYMPIFETNSRAWYGKDFLEVQAWCDGVNANGADLQSVQVGTVPPSAEYPTQGQVVDYYCEGGLGSEASQWQANGCGRPLGLGARIYYTVVSGNYETPEPTEAPTPQHLFDASTALVDLSTINNFCNDNSMNCTYVEAPTTQTETIVITIGSNTYKTGDTNKIMINQGTAISVSWK